MLHFPGVLELESNAAVWRRLERCFVELVVRGRDHISRNRRGARVRPFSGRSLAFVREDIEAGADHQAKNQQRTEDGDRRAHAKPEGHLLGIAHDFHIKDLDGAGDYVVRVRRDQVEQRAASLFIGRQAFAVGPGGLDEYLGRPGVGGRGDDAEVLESGEIPETAIGGVERGEDSSGSARGGKPSLSDGETDYLGETCFARPGKAAFFRLFLHTAVFVCPTECADQGQEAGGAE